MPESQAWFEKDLVARFGRYVAIHTTSDPHSASCPSTPGQWDLANLLADELRDLGIQDVEVTGHCYVCARVPAHPKASPKAPVLGFLAHLDTSSDSSGQNVKLEVHENYKGGLIKQKKGPGIDPSYSPELLRYLGRTILCSDGSTLLGADDKAGVAEIMSALRWLREHPDFVHGPLDIVFTPDEEIGRGVDKLPMDWLRAKVCYTFDGDEEASYNDACFNAWAVSVNFTGVALHPGYSRGRMVNAIQMAVQFVSMIPRNESPEATDGLFGFYSTQEITGTMEKANVRLIVRDFEKKELDRRVAFLKSAASCVEQAFPGSSVLFEAHEQYRNMQEILATKPLVIKLLKQAISQTGMEAWSKPIRGGTDGARLTEKGILTPNIFAGGMNFHSVREWVPLDAMVRASQTMIKLAGLWAKQTE